MPAKFTRRADGSTGTIPENIELSFSFATATQAIDQLVWVAPYACELVAVNANFGTTSTSGTVMLEKCPVGTAAGSGTDLLASTMSIAGTAGTTVAGSLGTTRSDRVFAATDRLAIDFGGTVTNLVNLHVNISLKKLQSTASTR
jgi:hypothetical protein